MLVPALGGERVKLRGASVGVRRRDYRTRARRTCGGGVGRPKSAGLATRTDEACGDAGGGPD